MANVERYRDSEGRERFAARWREGAKQMKARRDKDGEPFKSARAAMKYAQDQESDARRGRNPHRSDVTVGEYAAYWCSTRHHRKATKDRLSYSLKHFEASGLAQRRLVDVRQSMVQAWASEVRESRHLRESTMRKIVGDLGAVFRSAVHDDLIAKTPVVNIRLGEREEVERIVPLTRAQVRALADAMPDRYQVMVLVQADLGLRAGELVALQRHEVDFDRLAVRIEAQRTNATPHLRTELKTRSSRRTVPMSPELADELVKHIETYVQGEDLFTTSLGTPVHIRHYQQMLHRAVVKAGLPKGTSSHDLRHHYATELLGQGLTSVEVGHLLGHKDGVLVERVYGHSRVDASDRARQALSRLWRDEAA